MKNKLRIKGSVKIFLPLFIFLLSLLYTQSVQAADATQSSDIKAKLAQLEQEIASKAAALKNQVSQELQNKVYAGVIQSMSDSQYTLTNMDGATRIVTLNEFTKDEVDGKKLSQKIGKGDFIIALGDVDDKSNLVAKRVIKEATPSATLTDYVWGKILSKDSSSISVLTKDNKEVSINFTGDTPFKLNTDDSNIDGAKVNNFLVGVGALSKDGTSLKARLVYLIPYAGYIKPATSSATPSAKKK